MDLQYSILFISNYPRQHYQNEVDANTVSRTGQRSSIKPIIIIID